MALDRSRVAFVVFATPAELLQRHQQASDVINIACEAAPHYTACLLSARCATRGPYPPKKAEGDNVSAFSLLMK